MMTNPSTPHEPNALRKYMKQVRSELSPEERDQIFKQILSQLYSIPEFNNATNIAAYYGKTSAGEFDTVSLLQNDFRSRKGVIFTTSAPRSKRIGVNQGRRFRK